MRLGIDLLNSWDCMICLCADSSPLLLFVEAQLNFCIPCGAIAANFARGLHTWCPFLLFVCLPKLRHESEPGFRGFAPLTSNTGTNCIGQTQGCPVLSTGSWPTPTSRGGWRLGGWSSLSLVLVSWNHCSVTRYHHPLYNRYTYPYTGAYG